MFGSKSLKQDRSRATVRATSSVKGQLVLDEVRFNSSRSRRRYFCANNSNGKATGELSEILLEHGADRVSGIGDSHTGSAGDDSIVGSGSRGNGNGRLYGLWTSFRWHGGAEMNPLGVVFLVLLGLALMIGFIVLTDKGLKWKDRP